MLKEKTKYVVFNTVTLQSIHLKREVIIDLYFPSSVIPNDNINLLLINDGQDLIKMPFLEMLDTLFEQRKIQPILCVGIHCGIDRKMEYGVAGQPDYLGRGAKASNYTSFILQELLPLLQNKLNVSEFKETAFAGFSLGGLTALDIVWNHSSLFTKVGVFSGSLWWRKKAYEDGYTDEADRIMHNQIKKGSAHPNLKFFLQTGLLDEKLDRNNNGVIDSIDDALDLIAELKTKGYSNEAIHYLEIADGKHDVSTWARALPSFLEWGWGKQ